MSWYDEKPPRYYKAGTRPEAGDILAVRRKNAVYTHYGICVGNERVVHFSGPIGDDLSGKDTRIRNTALKDFLRGDPLLVQVIDEERRRYNRKETVERALAAVGKTEIVGGRYNFMLNNCEHFATWCVYGEGLTHQVHDIGSKAVGAQLAVTEAVVNLATAVRQFRYRKAQKQKDGKSEAKTEPESKRK